MRKKKRKTTQDEIIKLVEENNNNKEIIKKCVSMYPKCLEYIEKELLLDREFCKELLLLNGLTLCYMPKEIKKDKELVLIAIDKSAGFALKFADNALKKDFEIVKHAILKYKAPLKYASEDLQEYFKNKWDEFFKKHPYQKWTGYKVEYNGIRNTPDEINKIYKSENKKNTKKDKVNRELETLKECLEEMQISFNEYDFEEND